MTLGDVLERLEPVQQQVVALVYFEGRSSADAARALAVEGAVVAAALAAVFRSVAWWLLEEDVETTTYRITTVGVHAASERPGPRSADTAGPVGPRPVRLPARPRPSTSLS